MDINFKKVTQAQIMQANKEGLANKDDFWTYHTPLLANALELGRRGVDLSAQNIVNGYRFGAIPESGLSHNYADDRCERGLSLAAIEGQEEIDSAVWFRSRGKVEVKGILLPFSGSDGEALVLPIDAVDNYDAPL